MTYYVRLDDACEKRDIASWDRMEKLLDNNSIKPLVGIIPHCQDPDMDKYALDPDFWNRVKTWIAKGWTMALHGYTHVFETENGGINPVNNRSEFAGVSLERQREKIRLGVECMLSHGIEPKVFFAPAHTFDINTLEALRQESKIRVISDTVANKPYQRWGFTFIPQQSGHVRKLPFDTVTFCYHPNVMTYGDYEKLETFIKENRELFKPYHPYETKRKYGIVDKMLNCAYFARRK